MALHSVFICETSTKFYEHNLNCNSTIGKQMRLLRVAICTFPCRHGGTESWHSRMRTGTFTTDPQSDNPVPRASVLSWARVTSAPYLYSLMGTGHQCTSNGAITTTTGERESRPRGRPPNVRRLSKSMSPNNNLNKSKFITFRRPPPPTTYGIVAPKVNPNTPQVLLRRPKDGEMVLSLQGSPLYTGAVPMDQVANINIPLHNGKLLTLQPHRGLRLSQIPELDPNTAQQLKTLRDNLDKVCQATTGGSSKR